MSVFAASAWSAVITVDGSLEDWGIEPASPIIPNDDDQWKPPAMGSYVVEHSVGEGGRVGPGGGGHPFDMVAMYSHIEGRVLYLAFVAGFHLQGELDPLGEPYRHYMGDVFIDFGSNGGWRYKGEDDFDTGVWDLAFRLSETLDPKTTQLRAHRDFQIFSTPHSVTGWHSGPYQAAGGEEAGEVEFAFVPGTVANGMVDTNGNFYHVYEFGYELEDYQLAAIEKEGRYRVFVTMNSGNDYLHLVADGPVTTRPRSVLRVSGNWRRDFMRYGGGISGGANYGFGSTGGSASAGGVSGFAFFSDGQRSVPPRWNGGWNGEWIGEWNGDWNGESAWEWTVDDDDYTVVPLPPALGMTLAGVAALALAKGLRRRP